VFIILNVVILNIMWLKWILQHGVQIEVHVMIPNSTSVNCLFYHKIKDIFELVCRYLKNVPLKKKKKSLIHSKGLINLVTHQRQQLLLDSFKHLKKNVYLVMNQWQGRRHLRLSAQILWIRESVFGNVVTVAF